MNLRDIDPKKFVPMGHDRKALLVERLEDDGRIIIPDVARAPRMTDGIEPPTLIHHRPQRCKVLSVGPNVRGVKPGDVISVPGAGNCYADWEDGEGPGSRLLIREGDIAGVMP